MNFKLPDLPFETSALEPAIDAKTMEIHHDKHHAAYTDKLNDAVSGTEWAEQPIEKLLASLGKLPAETRTAVRNNGGGYYNHKLFWSILAPQSDGGGTIHAGDIRDALVSAFGSFDGFKKTFKEKATGQFGSGWAWLIVRPSGVLDVVSTANQDSPLMPKEFGGCGDESVPILGLDVWEHAYYLNYQNRRPDYVDAWWSVVNWHQVEANYHDVVAIATP